MIFLRPCSSLYSHTPHPSLFIQCFVSSSCRCYCHINIIYHSVISTYTQDDYRGPQLREHVSPPWGSPARGTFSKKCTRVVSSWCLHLCWEVSTVPMSMFLLEFCYLWYYSLSTKVSIEQMAEDLETIFSQFGPCYAKIKQGKKKDLPGAFVQFEVSISVAFSGLRILDSVLTYMLSSAWRMQMQPYNAKSASFFTIVR